MDKYFNNVSLFRVIFRWKWHIAAITVLAAALGAVFSGPSFITPMYKSEAILYPSNVSAYSDETFTEQMLQIMESQDIMDSVVNNFDLMKHYEIDKSYKYWKTALIGEYRDNVSISKTPYDAVKIKVLDKDPQIACDMVYDIIRLYDQKVGKLHKIKRLEAVNMFKDQLDGKAAFIDSLKKELAQITSEHNILNYTYLSGENSISYFNNNNDDTKTFMPEVINLVELITNESANYSDVKLEYELELRFYESDMTFSNVISEPFVADKKSYPVRWVIVALCGISALVLSVFVVYIFDRKDINK